MVTTPFLIWGENVTRVTGDCYKNKGIKREPRGPVLQAAAHLNEVGVESGQQHGFEQLVLVAVHVVQRRLTLAVVSAGNQLGVAQVLAELSDET